RLSGIGNWEGALRALLLAAREMLGKARRLTYACLPRMRERLGWRRVGASEFRRTQRLLVMVARQPRASIPYSPFHSLPSNTVPQPTHLIPCASHNRTRVAPTVAKRDHLTCSRDRFRMRGSTPACCESIHLVTRWRRP